jgi:hypothetical protein
MQHIEFPVQQIKASLMVVLIYDVDFERIHYVDRLIQEISLRPILMNEYQIKQINH